MKKTARCNAGVLALFGVAGALVACQGASRPTPFAPAVAGPVSQANALDDRRADAAAIASTCGKSIALTDIQPVKCNFSQADYTGPFAIDAAALERDGIANVAPKTGTSKTTFTVSAGANPGFGSFTVSGGKGETLAIAFARLASAKDVVCVRPVTASKVVSLPKTGGVSGTLSLGAFAARATGCDEVEIATGADMEAAAVARAREAGAPYSPPHPLGITISIGEGLDDHPVFGYSTIVTGMQLMVSPDLHFPDGTYYATITTTSGRRSSFNGVVAFVATKGVLKIAPITLPHGKTFPFVLTARTSSILTLYPRGVVPPAPSPSPTPSTTPTPSTSPSPTAKPTTTPTPLPTSEPCKGCYGNPPPKYGDQIGTWSYDVGQGCVSYTYPCKLDDIPLEQQGCPGSAGACGTIAIFGGFYGAIRYHADIAYMGLYPPIHNNCPKEWRIVPEISGSGAIDVPKSAYFSGQTCDIVYSTLPPGKSGSYYTETIVVVLR